MGELSRRYAQALYELYPDEAAVQSSAQALLDANPLFDALCQPWVHADEKQQVLKRLDFLTNQPLLLHFYQLLVQKGRIQYLGDIVKDYHILSLEHQNKALCTLTCAQPLSQAEQDQLRAALCRLHHKADIEFTVKIDPALLGGFTLALEGVTYDNSIKGSVAGLKRHLRERRLV